MFEHVSEHNFVHMMSTCQLQQTLAKSDLYHTTSSTSSFSRPIGSSGIKAHGINQTLNHSWTIVTTALLTASPKYHSQALVRREAAALVNHNHNNNNNNYDNLNGAVPRPYRYKGALQA